ncbi:hypothetical protein PSU4_19970 [Pseudonocardia sulfidoxydans NBRC 16205]|uniref:Lipoprotein n=1 Tax=Pseudonocardia sulfidoxydans NBRC 16205 TaxID=1223511 RepID=A0A511DF56_9PSEU|nr:hypothetical protein [Pseudonocardia sulfidoxydans]GEL23043.1 hypothetical protein PSU4_19970 [Pseudonocardia sulfidoxydans NBRC 16205]
MNRVGRRAVLCAAIVTAGLCLAGCGVTTQREPERLESSVLAPPPTPTVTVVPEVPVAPPAVTSTAPPTPAPATLPRSALPTASAPAG